MLCRFGLLPLSMSNTRKSKSSSVGVDPPQTMVSFSQLVLKAFYLFWLVLQFGRGKVLSVWTLLSSSSISKYKTSHPPQASSPEWLCVCSLVGVWIHLQCGTASLTLFFLIVTHCCSCKLQNVKFAPNNFLLSAFVSQEGFWSSGAISVHSSCEPGESNWMDHIIVWSHWNSTSHILLLS